MGGIELTYNEALNEASVPAASAFSVSVAGGAAVTPSTVTISGKSVVLALASPPTSGQTSTVSYTAPETNPLKDLSGNSAANLTNQAVSAPAPEATETPLTVERPSWRHRAFGPLQPAAGSHVSSPRGRLRGQGGRRRAHG